MIAFILPLIMRAGSLLKRVPLWAFAIAGLVIFAWLQTARLDKASKGWINERANHEVTRGSVRILATAVVMQNAAVDALKRDSGARAKTGIKAVGARQEVHGDEAKRIARIMLPASLGGRCVTPASVLESGL